MTLVMTRAETNVLTLARVAVGAIPAHDAMRLLVSTVAVPGKLGPTARAALSDTLSRGTVLSLVRQGGWQEVEQKRLWERISAPPLRFTSNVVRLLNWMLQSPLSELEQAPLQLQGPLTVAEDALVALMIDRLRGTGCDVALVRQPALRALPLTVLSHAGLFAREASLDQVPAFDVAALSPWVEGLRSLMARSWLSIERSRRDLTEPSVLSRLGRAQESVLGSWLDALQAAQRRELATFIIDAAVPWVTPERKVDDFVHSMTPDAPLRERTEARRRSAVLVRTLGVLRQWDQEHRAVRFIDDGYDVAQRLVADWERLGERGFSKAADLVAELDAIPTLAPAEPNPPAKK